MATPLAVIIRFDGDTNDLAERFERVRRSWIEAQDSDYERPLFYAVCKTDEGIAVITAWETAVGHRAFGQGLHPHIEAAGMSAPTAIERMKVETFGW